MKIAFITQREELDKYGVPIDVLESPYISFLAELGFTPLPVSNFISLDSIERLFEIDCPKLLVLGGGGSLQKDFYDADYGYTEQVNRDKLEARLLEDALKKKIPILAICRGMQFINGYFGGKVSKLANLTEERPMGKDHPVQVLANGSTCKVNNFHNDGIFTENLCSLAKASHVDTINNVVEAFTMQEKRILALQWHPERRFEAQADRQASIELVQNFLKANLL